MKKIFLLCLATFSLVFSLVSSVFASEAHYQDLKNIPIEMITPAYGDISNPNFQKNT